MTRWEYTIFGDAYVSQEIIAKLNALGEYGWELVAVVDAEFIMKRVVAPAEKEGDSL